MELYPSDFQAAVAQLRQDVTTAIATALREFERHTSATPSSIHVQMVETTTIGQRPTFALGDVRFRFEV